MKPAFEKNNIPIVLSASDYYAPYASVVLQSIIDCASTEFNYDIIILTKDMTSLNQETMRSMVCHLENISLRFYDMSQQIEKLNCGRYRLIAHFSIESYFRSFIPYVLEEYEKVIYCDSDLVFLQDPAELYQTELDSNIFASVIDPIYIYNQKMCGPYWESYNQNILHIPAEAPYVNTGIMVWNIALFREVFSLPYILQVGYDGQYIFCDQDVLNVVCVGNIQFLDCKWNVLAETMGRGTQLNLLLSELDYGESYRIGREHAGVWHWADQKKPWNTELVDHGYLFWRFAKKGPFYEHILYRMSFERYQMRMKEMGIQATPTGRI